MKFRFSIRWMLLAVIYVSVVLGACVRPGEGWHAATWLLNAGIVLYAILAVAFFRGRRQAVVAGFLLFVGCYLGLLWRAPDVLPEKHVTRLFGLDVVFTDDEANQLKERVQSLQWEMSVAANSQREEYRERVLRQYHQAQDRLDRYETNRFLGNILHAIAMMMVGMLGCVIGAHVWTSAQGDDGS
jgi:hypothetical protein